MPPQAVLQIVSLANIILVGRCRIKNVNVKFHIDFVEETDADLMWDAERAGFEPAIRFPVYTLSRRAPSTTRTPLPGKLGHK